MMRKVIFLIVICVFVAFLPAAGSSLSAIDESEKAGRPEVDSVGAVLTAAGDVSLEAGEMAVPGDPARHRRGRRQSSWRNARHEIFFAAGTSNFMGELGGSDRVGKPDVRDLDFKSSRWAVQGGYNYKLAERWAIGASVSVGHIYGNDAFTEEFARSIRNLHFRSIIVDLTASINFSIIPERDGNMYSLKKRYRRRNTPNLYIFTGISGFYFNPKAKYEPEAGHEIEGATVGEWYDLRPLCTEGQGKIPTRKKYTPFSAGIPVGIGLTYTMDKNVGIGAEFGFRYTFTDYIDDVSNTYVDPDILDSDLARYFSQGTATQDLIYGPGQQRGNCNRNDSYMFFTLKVTYKFNSYSVPKF